MPQLGPGRLDASARTLIKEATRHGDEHQGRGDLARLLKLDEFAEVVVPSGEQEAARDLVWAGEDVPRRPDAGPPPAVEAAACCGRASSTLGEPVDRRACGLAPLTTLRPGSTRLRQPGSTA